MSYTIENALHSNPKLLSFERFFCLFLLSKNGIKLQTILLSTVMMQLKRFLSIFCTRKNS